ncbi:MAG: magnesium-translocating P-type ATPase [Candidatus Gracilibacteria bacterium]
MAISRPSIQEASAEEKAKVVTLLATNEKGLTSIDASARLLEFGRNILVEEKKTWAVFEFIKQFKDPLILILLFASVISYIRGEVIDGSIVMLIILVSTCLNFFQERQASHAAEKLKAQLANTATVIRDQKPIEISFKDVVPGDILVLNAGDLIPADARILESKDFFVNESSLTGESLPSEKSSDTIRNGQGSLSDLHNIVFSGTNVVTGSAHAVVLATGGDTEFGKIAKTLDERPIPSEFSQGIHQFSFLILKLTIAIVLFVFLFNSLVKHDIMGSFMFAIAIAVGLTPELLPMIMSITMGRGALKMADKGVVVKKLLSIPNLGSMNILCTDKTGTLTQGRIDLVKYEDAFGNNSEEVLRFAYLNSAYQTSIENPMDEAVLRYKREDVSEYEKVDEIPFDFVRKKMSVVVSKDKVRYLVTKGAPEEILKDSVFVQSGDTEISLEGKVREDILKRYADLSREGYRVVAIAYKKVAEKPVYHTEEESEMTLLGFIAFLDPAKQDVKEVVEALKERGVAIKIITGDNELVTEKICKDLGIPVEGIILGGHLASLTDDAIRVVAMKNTIFARFSPDEKNRIIMALKASGYVVGYMGDGINDAPSLQTADIGISVNNAVDVAKESADIILTQKSLKVLLDGIEEGRKTFGNSMKYIMMGISSNFGNMFSVLGAVILLPFLPMLPIQILLNNLLYDVSQMTLPEDHIDPEYTLRPKRWNMGFVKKFMLTFGLISSFFDFVTFGLLYYVFQANAAMFQTGWFIESLATQTLIIHVIRTKKIPFIQSRPHWALVASTFAIVILGWVLPFTPLGSVFGFVALPWYVLLALAGVVCVYLLTVEVGKRIFYRYVKD